ncbi:hypothetical protein MKX01_015902 [Papaver californicum]|nr:hypothetical protein MKX01_015902 [Papaver californicum]
MGSDGDDGKDLTKENENAADDLEPQRFNSESSLELSDLNGPEFQSTEPFNDTSTDPGDFETQVWVDDETQEVVEDCNNDDENGIMTQLVVDDTEVQNYSEGDDGELSDRTDVLTEAGESDHESERGVGLGDDDGVQGLEDVAVYSNDSIIECRNSGKNVSTAIPLSDATKQPDCGFVPSVDGTNANRASILNSSEPISSVASDEDGEMDGVDDPSLAEEKRIDVDRDYEGENMKLLKDEIRNRDAVRKLFTDETPYKNSGATIHSDSTYEGKDFPQLDDGHKLSDLSYLNSQEPGELSQANALDVVDKFLLINNVDCSQEDIVYHEKMAKEKSPVVPSAKGPQTLAHRSNTKSPVGGAGTLDWDASREDEGGGEFFSKNKDVFFTSCGRGRGHGHKSFTQPRIPRSLKSGQGKSVDDKQQDVNLRQKIMGTVHSDSRLLLQKLRTDDKKIPQIRARKNLFREFDELMHLESAEQQLEESNTVKDSWGMYDVGIDTQMAAEATEALVCGFPNNHVTADAIQVLPNSGDVMSIKSYTEHASTRKRLSSSDIEGLFKQSKRTKTHDTRLSTEILTSSRMSSKTLGEDLRPDLAAIPKRKRGRPKSIEKPNIGVSIPSPSRVHPKRTKLEAFSGSSAIKPKQKRCRPKPGVSPSTGNAAAPCESSSRRFPKVVAQRKAVGVVDKSNSDEVDKRTNSSLSGMSSFTNPSPVARRTRQCRTINALKKLENLPGSSGEKKHDDIPVANAFETEKVCSKMGTYTPEPSVCKGRCSESGRNLIDDVTKDKPTLHEPLGLEFSHERSAKTYLEINPTSKHRGREKNVTMSGHLKESDNLGSSSTVVDGVLEVNGPITRSIRLRNHIRNTAVELDMKRKAPSSIAVHPSSSSVKNSKGNLIEQVVEPLYAYVAVNGSLSVNDKAVLKGDGKDTASMKFEKNVSMSGPLKESGNLGSSSKVVDGLLEVNGPITRSGRLRNHIRSTAVELDMKRGTQASISVHPSSSSVKNSKGNLIGQVVEPLCAYAAVNGSLSVNVKALLKDDRKDTSSKKSDKKGDASPVSTHKDVVGENAGLSTPKVIPHGLLCVTPDNCTTPANVSTPLNEASPICFGNGYQKLPCKRSPSKPSLARELSNLYMDALHTPSSKDLRKRRDIGSIHVLFSRHLGDAIIKQQKKILARLGASVASSSLGATHFVADKFVRTRNMLEAIALGKLVVTHLWLKSSGQVSCFTDERNYILRDLKKEKEIGFSMPISLTRAGQSPLLKGRKVFITANVKPGQELVASLVKAVHGQAVERLGRSAMKDDKVLDDLLVFSCEEDYEICVPLLEKGVAIYSSELLLNGIVMQKLEYERHRLFNDNIKRTRSSIWIRKDGDKFLPVTKSK